MKKSSQFIVAEEIKVREFFLRPEIPALTGAGGKILS